MGKKKEKTRKEEGKRKEGKGIWRAAPFTLSRREPIIRQLRTLKQMITDGVAGKTLIGALKRQISRAVGGETGVMTEKDVEDMGGDISILGAAQRWIAAKSFNKLTEKDQTILRRVSDLAEQRSSDVTNTLVSMITDPIVQDIESHVGVPVNLDSLERNLGIKAYRESMTQEKTSKSVTSPGMVRMKTPDGRLIEIPKENVEKAKARGAVEVK